MSRDRWLLAAAFGVGAAAMAGLAQTRFSRKIAQDPAGRELQTPPSGQPLHATSADGTRIYAEAFGPPEGLPVVLAHGWTENLTYWVYVIRRLAGLGFRVVAYDLRGHGHSGGAGDYSIDRFGEDLEAVLAAVVPEGQKAMVVGHSLGAMSIAAWARDHDVERRVGAAALLNTGVGDLMAESLIVPLPRAAAALTGSLAQRGFIGSRAPLPQFSSPLSHAMLRWVAFGPAASPAQIAYYERMLFAMPPQARADVGIAISAIELHDDLPRLTVPTIVLAGENDRLTPPSHARRIAQMLPQLERLIILPDTGHMAPLERHEAVSDALVELAEKLRQSAPAGIA
ncbi:MAG: alpha/beta fold hydrolase [Solirubrobacteraceae bacterium]